MINFDSVLFSYEVFVRMLKINKRIIQMGEPRLEDISDYNTLSGQKKKVVWAVVFALLVMVVMYIIAYRVYDNKEDTIQVEQTIDKLPNSIVDKKID